MREEIACVEYVITQELVQATMPSVRARARHHTHYCAGGETALRVEIVGGDIELLGGIGVRKWIGVSTVVIVVVRAIQLVVDLSFSRCANRSLSRVRKLDEVTARDTACFKGI